MTDLAARLQRLEDIEEIRRLKLRYAKLCDDNYNPDGLAALFTEDGVWDAGDFGVVRGREDIRAHWAKTSEQFPFALHYISNHVVDIEPLADEASGRCYLWEPLTMNGRACWSAVTYDERYRRVQEAWYFSEMKLQVHFLTPYEEGWAKEPFVTS